jgi:hypothetical protein
VRDAGIHLVFRPEGISGQRFRDRLCVRAETVFTIAGGQGFG